MRTEFSSKLWWKPTDWSGDDQDLEEHPPDQSFAERLPSLLVGHLLEAAELLLGDLEVVEGVHSAFVPIAVVHYRTLG